jgi:hypothetical protein
MSSVRTIKGAGNAFVAGSFVSLRSCTNDGRESSMATSSGGGMQVIHRVEFEEWLSRARRTWSPITVAERQFNAIRAESDDVAGLAAYDDLYDVANLAVEWLEDNPCPDFGVGRRFKAQMMAYRAVADTVRSTITGEDGDAMVAQLRHLRDVIDGHAGAIEEMEAVRTRTPPEEFVVREASVTPYRRRVPRQPAGWDGTCHIDGEGDSRWRRCQVVDISMLGLGVTFDHGSPLPLVGRHISVDVPAVGESVSIRLEGEIAYARPTLRGTVRVGIEFDGSFESEVAATAPVSRLRDRTPLASEPQNT